MLAAERRHDHTRGSSLQFMQTISAAGCGGGCGGALGLRWRLRRGSVQRWWRPAGLGSGVVEAEAVEA
uniref:Uncharacterized protein n=1 Tax=Oryza rufipogon TaxID=4529 RepID=A0A0E0MYD7_ORYRU